MGGAMCTTRVAGVVVGAVFTVVASRHKWLPMLVSTLVFFVFCVVLKKCVFFTDRVFFWSAIILMVLSKTQNYA